MGAEDYAREIWRLLPRETKARLVLGAVELGRDLVDQAVTTDAELLAQLRAIDVTPTDQAIAEGRARAAKDAGWAPAPGRGKVLVPGDEDDQA